MRNLGSINESEDIVTKDYADQKLPGRPITKYDYDHLSPAEKDADIVYFIIDDDQDALEFDEVPIAGSDNPVKSKGIKAALDAKQNTLTFDQTPTAGSQNPVTSGGVKSALNFVPDTGNAGFHNSIYRGKYLGSSVTAAQYAAISAGTFDDLYIGDYWTINSVNWRIAAFDYWLHDGDIECTTHHVVIVPDTILYYSQMNTSNVTTGGYVGSAMYTTNLATVKSTIQTAFGSAHILSHRELLTNAVSGDKASGWAWYDSDIDLMNEVMVYGCHAWGSASGYETGIDKSQLALFALAPEHICNREVWWLRGVVSSATFAIVSPNGLADNITASNFFGVRPVFALRV